MISFRDSATTSDNPGFFLDIPVPGGAQAGDFMIAHLTYTHGDASPVTIPAGWTLVRSESSIPDSGGVTGFICTKTASGSEPATYRFDFHDFRRSSGGIVAYAGVKNALPIDVSAAGTFDDTTVPATPSIDTVYASPWLLWFLAARDNASVNTSTPPSGMTQRWRVNAPSPGCVSLLAEQVFSGSGSSGIKTGGLSPSAQAVAQVLFLSPADESPNHPPHAHAGFDQATQIGVGVTLDGSSSSDVDPGDTLSYAWTHLSGPNGTAQLSSTTATSPLYTPAAAGLDVFRLTVTDLASATSSDDVSISTTPAGVNVSFASGSGTSMTIPLPIGAQTGETAFFALSTKPLPQPPKIVGWSAVDSAINGSSSTDIAVWVFARRLLVGDLGGSVTATVEDVFGSAWTAHIVTIGDLHPAQLYNKTITTTPVAAPGSFSNSIVGGAGGATYTYTVTSIDAAGESIGSTVQTISGAPNTLTVSNYVRLMWQPVSRATSYKVYGRTGGSQKLIATVSTPQSEVPDEYYYLYRDIGTSPGGQSPPTQQPIEWLVDGLATNGDGAPRPERLYTTYANARLLMFASGQLDVANPAVTVADPVGGVQPVTTTTDPDSKIVLHSAIETLGAAGNVGTRLFTPSDYATRWATIAVTLRPPAGNGSPTAIAGFDQNAEAGSTVYLDATQSLDQDGDTLTYAWTQTAGSAVTLSSSTAATPTFIMPSSNVTFSLTVTDPGNLHSTETVTITMVSAGKPKVLNASNDWVST
jgi:plastocyanin